jgi:hypothetical protein
MQKSDSAILPGMSAKPATKPRIAIVGAGNLASALAASLHGAGYSIEQIISRSRAQSLQRARRLAREVGASAVTIGRAQIRRDRQRRSIPDESSGLEGKSGATFERSPHHRRTCGAAGARGSGSVSASLDDVCVRFAAIARGSSIRN